MDFQELRRMMIGIRNDRGLNQAGVARRLRRGSKTFRGWELGGVSPRIEELEDWADLLGYGVSYRLYQKGTFHE